MLRLESSAEGLFTASVIGASTNSRIPGLPTVDAIDPGVP
jgi:hypothetical protein